MFNSFNVEFPDDPLRESFVREILEDEILQELVETIHFLSNGIVLTTDIHKRKEKSFVEVIVFEIDVGNDADQFKKVYVIIHCRLLNMNKQGNDFFNSHNQLRL